MSREKPAEKPEDLRTLMKKHRIVWLGIIDEADWPDGHRDTFRHIKQRGHLTFDTYSEDSDVGLLDEPWRAQTRDRAIRITKKAKRCLDADKNEAGWRFDIEHEVLRRFEIEVACRKCRARLWRAQVQARNDSNDTHAIPFRESQSSLATCKCRSQNESFEPGLNNLFDSRAQESIVFEEDVAIKLPSGKQPDRVYGLCPTGRFRKIMGKHDKRPVANGRIIEETIASTPFRPAGTDVDVMFPFLILEAKAEKFNGGFSTARTQSAFAIRALLNLQLNLKKAAGKDSQWEHGPLVWFFTNCGEQWRVNAAYVDESSNGEIYYRIIDLWSGRINDKDDALQLLLIVDYIFDWARGVYRDAILSELAALVADITPSLADDSEMASITYGIPSLLSEETNGENMRSPFFDETREISGSIPGFDRNEFWVVRDARCFVSRFFGLVITKDDVEPMMACWNAPSMSKKQARQLHPVLKYSWRLTEETIKAAEHKWTGKNRESSHVFGSGETFYAIITVCAYHSQSWERVLELSCLAVSENAVGEFQRIADWKNGTRFDFGSAPFVTEEILCAFLHSTRQGSTKSALWAALNRSCISSSRACLVEKDNAIPIGSIAETAQTQLSDPNTPVMAWNDKGEVRDVVVNYYQRYKIGRKEPTDPFIRSSHRMEQQTDVAEVSIWDSKYMRILENKETVVAYVNGGYAPFERAGLCLFLVDGSRLTLMEGITGLEFREDDIASGFQVVLETFSIGHRGGREKAFWNKSVAVSLSDMQDRHRRCVLQFLREVRSKVFIQFTRSMRFRINQLLSGELDPKDVCSQLISLLSEKYDPLKTATPKKRRRSDATAPSALGPAVKRRPMPDHGRTGEEGELGHEQGNSKAINHASSSDTVQSTINEEAP